MSGAPNFTSSTASNAPRVPLFTGGTGMGMTKPKEESTLPKSEPLPKPSFPPTTKTGETTPDTHSKTPPQTNGKPPPNNNKTSSAAVVNPPSATNVKPTPTTSFKSPLTTNVKSSPAVQPTPNQGTLASGKKDSVVPSKEDSKGKQPVKVIVQM